MLKERMLLVFTCTLLLLSGYANTEQDFDSGADILYSMLQSDGAVRIPDESSVVMSSVVTAISVESDGSEEYSESVEHSQRSMENRNSNDENISQTGQEQSVDDGEIQERRMLTDDNKDQNISTEEAPIGRRLPPVRAPTSLTHPPAQDQVSVVVGHSSDKSLSEEIDVRVDEHAHQELDSTEVIPLGDVEVFTNEPSLETSTKDQESEGKDVLIVSSVQTSKSTEEGEVSYEEYSEESHEQKPDASTTLFMQTTTASPIDQNSKIIEAVVTSTSVIQGEISAVEAQPERVQIVTTSESSTSISSHTVTQVSVVTNVVQSEIVVSEMQPISSPKMEETITVPSENVKNVTTPIYSDSTVAMQDKGNDNPMDITVATTSLQTETTVIPTTTSNISIEPATSVTSVLNTTQSDTITTTPNATVLEKPQQEKPSGKSIKSFFDSKTLMTEDPSILAKLLPPMTTSATTITTSTTTTPKDDDNEKSVKIRTFTDKTGKTYTLKLLTEDPSVLAAMTPPPPPDKDNKMMKSILDKAGKNITLKILTEDPNVLAAMTPIPRTNVSKDAKDNTTTTITNNETTPPAKLAHYPGVPQQFGKLPIFTRHNVTRKPFLRERGPTKNPRPTVTFKKLSDIVNRSRIISTKRPAYLMKQVHEGQYQQDPDKRTEIDIPVTTIRTTTTLSPYFRWGPSLTVSANMKIIDHYDWSEDLRDSTSTKFKSLANTIEEQLDKIFRSSSVAHQYKGVQVDTFSKGSILVDYSLFLKEDTRGSINDMMKTAYRTGLGNGTYLGSFKVDPLFANFRVMTPQVVHAPPSLEETFGFPHWAIAVVGIVIAVVVFLIILFIIRQCSIRSTRRKYGAPLTDDAAAAQENKKSVRAGYDNPVAEGIYDLENIYNEKRRPVSFNQNNSGIYNSSYNNGSRSSQPDSKSSSKTSQKNNISAEKRSSSLNRQDSFGKDPPTRFKSHTIANYDAWNEWEDFYETRNDRGKYHGKDFDFRRDPEKYYEKDYDTTF